MGYALASPGKRLRPVLTLAVGELCGAPQGPLLDLACSVEMVHASSLILDDLPLMDDGALRRGQPTVHLAFGEPVALLAAFALLNRSFATTAAAAAGLSLRRHQAVDLVAALAEAVGTRGLIGGQALDLALGVGGRAGGSRGERLPELGQLEEMERAKTASLFVVAARFGALAADTDSERLARLAAFADRLGLAFQITDDLLDAFGSPEEVLKDLHQDRGKVSFVTSMGAEAARCRAAELLAEAEDLLSSLRRPGAALALLPAFVRQRIL